MTKRKGETDAEFKTRIRAYRAANRDRLRESRRGWMRAWRAANPEKARERSRAWAAANPQRLRDMQRRANWKYQGLPKPARPEPRCCECCDKPPSSGHKSLCLDHNHETGEFRGWLCCSCNLAIGMLGDNIEGVFKAVRYLNRADLL